MDKLHWFIVFVIAASFFVTFSIILIARRYLRNRYVQEHVKDELIKTTNQGDAIHDLYFTHGETLNYIEKYVMCYSDFEEYLICHYKNSFKKIQFYVLCFGKGKKPFQVLRYSEKCDSSSSRIIALPKGTKKVNIIIGRVDDKVINHFAFYPLSRSKIRKFSLLASLSLVSLCVAADLLMSYIIGGSYYAMVYLNSGTNYIILGVSALLGILCYLTSAGSLMRSNRKSATGGVIEYEFI